MGKRVVSAANGRALFALVAVVVGACEAQVFAQGGVTIEVGDCIKLQTPEERFACYERQVDATGAQKGAAPSAPTPAAHTDAPQAAVPPAAGASTVGPPAAATAPATAVAAAAPAPAATPSAAKTPETKSASSASKSKNDPPEFVGTITELRETVPSAYLITLDDGQVWQQSYPEPYFLHTGMRVTLRPSKWGTSYRLSAEGTKGFIQVKRVQ
jgi:hypothetical protein